jgi:Transposase DDE domain
MFTTADLFGRFHSPRAPRCLQQARAAAPEELEQLFGSCLPPGLLSPADEGPNCRRRVYSLAVTFWTFLWQVLNPGSSTCSAVRKVMAWFALLDLPKVSEDDSPYCQARKRLDLHTLERALHASAQAAEQRADSSWRFHDREVLVGDGTTSSAPDTPENQRAYPQSSRQRPGCGFPLLKWVALFSLSTGALLEVAWGNKHWAELRLFRKIWDHLKAGMIFLADRAFGDFVSLAALTARQVDAVVRLSRSRAYDFRKGKRLGRGDRLVTWLKPVVKPLTATKKLWRQLPDQITLRLIRWPVAIPGFRTRELILVTTLLDSETYPAAELAGLYLRRWRVELFLRDIKSTLQLDVLSCKSPHMLHRELLMHLIAYNFVRCLMVESANLHGVELERLSFKGSVDTLRHFSLVIARARNRRQRLRLIGELLSALAGDPVPDRPYRIEPRCLKRRHKDFPSMMKPRAELRAKLLGTKRDKNKGA